MFFLALLLQQQPDAPMPPAAARLAALRRQIDTGRAAAALPELNRLAAAPETERIERSEVETLRGKAFYAEGNMQAAADAAALALAARPASPEAAELRGVALYRLGRPAEAIPLLESAGAARTGAADPVYALALCYAAAQRWDDARRTWARQYGFAPDSAEAYLLAGRLLFRRELAGPAQAFAEKALALEPRLPLAHLLLGEIALAGNHLPEAVREFEAERARNPMEGGVYDRLGDAYTRAGDYPRAQTALEQAVLLEPNATGPYILLGKVLLKQGDVVSAAGYLEHARQLDPRNFMTHNLLAQAYRTEGRINEAAVENAEAVRLQAGKEMKLTDVH